MVPVAGRDASGGLLVPTYAEITQYTAGQLPAAPAAGRSRLYADSAGRAQLLGASGGARRVATHWGSGTAFPTDGALAGGDTFLRTDVGTNGSLWQYTGAAGLGSGGWIPEGRIVCTSTTRPATPFAGMELYETDTRRSLIWDATLTAWFKTGGPVQRLATGMAPLVTSNAVNGASTNVLNTTVSGDPTVAMNVTLWFDWEQASSTNAAYYVSSFLNNVELNPLNRYHNQSVSGGGVPLPHGMSISGIFLPGTNANAVRLAFNVDAGGGPFTIWYVNWAIYG